MFFKLFSIELSKCWKSYIHQKFRLKYIYKVCSLISLVLYCILYTETWMQSFSAMLLFFNFDKKFHHVSFFFSILFNRLLPSISNFPVHKCKCSVDWGFGVPHVPKSASLTVSLLIVKELLFYWHFVKHWNLSFCRGLWLCFSVLKSYLRD